MISRSEQTQHTAVSWFRWFKGKQIVTNLHHIVSVLEWKCSGGENYTQGRFCEKFITWKIHPIACRGCRHCGIAIENVFHSSNVVQSIVKVDVMDKCFRSHNFLCKTWNLTTLNFQEHFSIFQKHKVELKNITLRKYWFSRRIMSIRTLDRFHALVQIWSFECLEALLAMSRKDSFETDENENESEYWWEEFVTKYIYSFNPLISAIVRYLGSRFQETLSAVDEENRTALHYAATIKDNGHFYNLLLHLGANSKAVDKVRKFRVVLRSWNLKLNISYTFSVWKISWIVFAAREFW